MSYDNIVIGGGHNGLVAAATLARRGRKVVLLERRNVLGGRIATESPWNGYRISPALHSLGRLRPRIVRDLGITLKVAPYDPVTFAPQPDGRYLALWRDVRQTVSDLVGWSRQDANRYAEYAGFIKRLTSFAASIQDMTPPPLDAPDLAQLFDLAQLGVRFRMLGRDDMIAAMRLGPMCVADFLGEWFESDALKAALAGPALRGLCVGPWAAGTGATLLYHTLEGPPGAPMGGTGQLADRLEAICRRHGAEIWLDAPVDKILVDGTRATGIRLANGDTLQAERIFSALDPKHTFLKLVGPQRLMPGFAEQVRHYHSRGVTACMTLALDALPQFACLKGKSATEVSRLLRGRIHIGPTLDFLERAADSVKYGRYAREPMIEMTVPTVADPSLAPPGRHLLSMQAQWAPYHLQEGSWDDLRERFADDVLRSLEPYLPGLASRVVQRHVATPLDLERSLGLTEGHLQHGEHSLHQLFFSRPIPPLAQYQSPLENVSLCGAGAHPGGGITGAAGYNAVAAWMQAEATPADRARAAAKPVGAGLAVLGAGLAMGVAVKAMTGKKNPSGG